MIVHGGGGVVAFMSRSVWLLSVWAITGCMNQGMSHGPDAGISVLAYPAIVAHTQVLPSADMGAARPALDIPGAGTAENVMLRIAQRERSSPLIRLVQHDDGSVAVYSGGRSASLLRGIDPALINPAVLPFLFPSCTVLVSP